MTRAWAAYEGTELCGIEIQHSSLWRITNKREARNIGFWADMLIIFKFPHNFFSPQVCPMSIRKLCNTKLHWSQALFRGVSVGMGDQNNKPLIKNRNIWPKILLTLTNADDEKANKYWYTVFRKSRRKFPGRSIENKIFTTWKQH